MKLSPDAKPAIRLEGLTKRFVGGSDAAAVAGIDLEIRDGEFFRLTR
jgi:ABC-type Fe3+/spermidine/putrescine transport system ATPase subunit